MTYQRPGEVVASGVWLYDECATMAVFIVRLTYDYYYSLWEEDGFNTPDDKPEPLGPDGFLYYVVFDRGRWDLRGGLPSLDAAERWAEDKVRQKIRWTGSAED